MANFSQFWAKRNIHYCLYYCCGEEICLQELVITTVKKSVSPNPLDYYSLDGGVNKIAEIMAILTQEVVSGRKFVLLRNAQKIKVFDRIVEWAKQVEQFTDTCLLVQTDEIKPITTEARYRPFVELGLFVECKPLSKSALLSWISETVVIAEAAFDMLLDVCGWELSRVLNEVSKLYYLGRQITCKDVELYCHRTYDERFVDLLLVDDKRAAANALSMLSFEDGAKIIGLLDYKLSLLLQLVILRKQGLSLKDAVLRLGIPFYAGKVHWDLGQKMPVDLIRKRLLLLVGVDIHYKMGNKGALEVLLTKW